MQNYILLYKLRSIIITASLEEYAMINRIDPTGENKIKLFLALYQQVSGTGKVYPPLIKENTAADDFKKWLIGRAIPPPDSSHDNLSVHELPSTNAVTNFMV